MGGSMGDNINSITFSERAGHIAGEKTNLQATDALNALHRDATQEQLLIDARTLLGDRSSEKEAQSLLPSLEIGTNFPCPWIPNPNVPPTDQHPWSPQPDQQKPQPQPEQYPQPGGKNTVPNPKPDIQRHHGVNLSGAEFGGNILPGQLGKEYIFPTTQELDFYKAKGMDLIRLPFLWERMQPGLMQKHSQQASVDRSFDSTYASQMESFLNAADQRGIKVILDAQQFGRFNQAVIGNSNITSEDFKQFWQQMANTFGKHSSLYGYDLSNEPHDEDSRTWMQVAQAGLDGIRAAGDKKTVFVEGNSWAGTQSWRDANEDLAVNDPANNVVYEAHSYWDADHSGTYNGAASSYDIAVNEARNRGILNPGEDPADMGVNYAKPFVDWLKQHNFRGYIGEYGVPSNDANWIKVQDKFLNYSRENNLDTTAWGGGPWWGPGYNLSLERGPAGEHSIDGPEPLNLKSIAKQC